MALGLPLQAQQAGPKTPDSEIALRPVSQTLQAAEVGADFQAWNRIEIFVDTKGNTVQITNLAYMELQTGMHYQEEGQWKDSREVIESYPGGAIARYGGHKVIFSENLAADVVVDMEMPDGQRLQSRVLGLSYRDSASGKTVLIAEAQKSVGEILNENQVMYADAFGGVKADLRYTYTKAGLEQDVILRERPPTPESYGLDPKTTRLQVLTEFLSPPKPAMQSVKTSDAAGELEDQMLNFGSMQMGAGAAFALGLDGAAAEKVPVVKLWTELDGRTILIEEVAVANLNRQLESLPAKKRTAFFWNQKPVQLQASAKLKLPARQAAQTAKHPMLMAKVTAPARGVVLDYILLSSQNNYTFKGDTTYYVSGSVNLSGTTTIEGGAVIKFAVNGATHVISPGIVKTATDAYRPAIFTAKDDNTVGDIISGSSGSPAPGVYYANPALDLPAVSNPALRYLRFAYAQQAVTLGTASRDFSHFQFVKCNKGIVVGSSQSLTLTLKNSLFAHVDYPFDLSQMSTGGGASIGAQNVTFDSATALVQQTGQTAYGLNLVNCILANVAATGWSGNPSDHLNGNNNGFYNTPFTFGTVPISPTANPPFQTAGAGNYYLVSGSGFNNQGTSVIDPTLLAELTRKTTVAPPNVTDYYFLPYIPAGTTWTTQVQRDTSCTPDLGYHYDPLDYCVSRATLAGALTVNAGTAVGYFGQYGFRIGTLSIQGAANNRCTLAHYSAVQEQPIPLGANASASYLLKSGSMPALNWRFTDVSATGGAFLGGGAANNLNVAQCSLYVARMSCDSGSVVTQGFTNNIIERCTLAYGQCGGAGYSVKFCNNLFRNSGLTAGYFCDNNFVRSVTMCNNLLVNSSFTYSTGSGTTPLIANNGYNNSTVTSQGTSPKTITTPDFQMGPLGPYYYPASLLTSGDLFTLVDAGNQTVVALGLDQFTTRTDQALDAGTVDIGFHYSPLAPPFANVLPGLQVCRGHGIPIILSGLSLNNSAACALFYTVVTQPQHGTLSGTPPNLTYTETDPNFCGNDSFTYKVNDGYLDSSPVTVTITVGDPNPVVHCRDVMTGINTPATFTLSGSGNTCGETLTFTAVAANPPANGTFVITPNGSASASVTYTPGSSTFQGFDDYKVTASDCGFNSPETFVTINVVPGPVLTTDCRTGYILLQWSVPQQLVNQFGNGYFHDFRIYRCQSTSGSCVPTTLYATVTDPFARLFVDTGVVSGNTYCYRVTFSHQDACDLSIPPYESPFSNTGCNQPCAQPEILITGNNAGVSGSLETYDFTDGVLINSFIPTGAANGRGIAIHGTELFYTELTGLNGPSNGIHVSPYGNQGSGGADIRTLPNPNPTAGIQDLAFDNNNMLYALTGYPFQQLKVFKLNPTTGAVIGVPIVIGMPVV